MNLVPHDHGALWTPAREFTGEDREIHATTIADLTALIAELGAVGIAAPQVGLSLRLFVSTFPKWPVCINPYYEPVDGFGHTSKPESSLNRKGWSTFVRRSNKIAARWTDADGAGQSDDLDGIEARVFAHLCDYLDGRPIFPGPRVIHNANVKL